MTSASPSFQFPDLSPLLRPRSIAVIGASEQPGNLGGVAISLLKKFGFPGKIWPVHPRRDSVHGLPSFATVAELPGPADLAIFAIGAAQTNQLVRDCAAIGMRHGVVWAGGYSEVGKEGAVLQDELLKTCRETGFSVVGPNCIGVINTALPLIASFASFLVESDRLVPGNIAMVSQSGGLATMAQAMAQNAGFGFSCTVSSGNEAVLTAAD
jgi:acetate---CoA ligase (ADP-forming)